MESIYGRPEEEIDPRAPVPKGKVVRTTSFADVNLMHDLVAGRSASGMMEMLNKTPVDWKAGRQAQVETATYGSEFMVARQSVERIQDLRYTLRSFGVPLEKMAWLFGDNKSVVTSSTIPHSTLSKRWNALSYHKVREAMAGGWLRFEHIPGAENLADIFTKPLPWANLRIFVEPLLFWKGDTMATRATGTSTEGSVAGPRYDQVAVSATGDRALMRDDTRATTRDSDARVQEETGLRDVHAGTSVLWNNMYAPLAEYD